MERGLAVPKTPKTAKPKPGDVATQIQGMQQELVDLQRSLAQLLDALIAEEKPGPKEIRKIKALKEQALKGGEKAIKEVQPARANPKRKKKSAPEAASEQATFDE
jgi:hypothetical protein